MAEPESAKRARSNTIGDVHINTTALSREEISQRVQHLDPKSIANILAWAAQTHPDITNMVEDAIRVTQERKRNIILDFDQDSRDVWRLINITHRSKRGSAQYDIAYDVADEVVDTIESITEECGPSVNPQTRFNGLSVLRKIGKTIALSSNDTLGHEVQKSFQSDSSLAGGMIKIINSMTADEVRAIREDNSSPTALWPKLQELAELAESYCIHPGLDEVLDLLHPRDEEEMGGEEEEEEEDEEDEDEKELDTEEDAIHRLV